MIRKNIFLLVAICMVQTVAVNAQYNTIDSLKQLLKTETKDTSRVLLLNQLSKLYLTGKPDTALVLSQEGLTLAKKIGFIRGEAISLNRMANVFSYAGNYPKGLELHLQMLKIAEAVKDERLLMSALGNVGVDYGLQGNYRQAINYALKAQAIARRLDAKPNILTNFIDLGEDYEKLDILDSARYYTNQAYDLALQLQNTDNRGFALNNFGNIYSKLGQDAVAMNYYRLSLIDYLHEDDEDGLCEAYMGMAKLFRKAGKADSALHYAKLSLEYGKKEGFTPRVMDASKFLTEYYISIHNIDSAFVYQSATIAAKDNLFSEEKQREIQSLGFDEKMRQQQIQDAKEQAQTQLKFNILFAGLAMLLIVAFLLYRNNLQKRKANVLLQKQKEEIDYKAKELSVQKENLQQSYNNVEQLGEIGRKITASLSVEKIIGTVYDNVNALMDAAVFGIGIYNDDLKRIEFPSTYENGEPLPFYANSIDDKNRFGPVCFISGKEIIIGNLNEEYREHIQEVLTPHEGGQPASVIFLPLIVKEKKLGVITVQSFKENAYSDYHLFMLRNIATYTAIAIENAESFETLKETVLTLKSTQSQLIQAEKMASLGELTASIAHEIQNPLNFVNNFSEVNKEMIAEMKEEIDKGNYDEVKLIANDIEENSEKINHHGKRADAIVKGMLQHSRANTGKKEPTDINALADEYLRLSYHGMRAKDKDLNATLKTDFDTTIGKINVVPQDIGRVLLNLFNNAFYSVTQKKKLLNGAYEPKISVRTKKLNGVVEIHVKDNGIGISPKIVDKVFQPFFTTKPTGQGTGLGLSLAYDIVKVHQGEIRVEAKETEGVEFIIQLPAVTREVEM